MFTSTPILNADLQTTAPDFYNYPTPRGVSNGNQCSVTPDANNVHLTLSPVPEQTTVGLIAAAGLASAEWSAGSDVGVCCYTIRFWTKPSFEPWFMEHSVVGGDGG